MNNFLIYINFIVVICFVISCKSGKKDDNSPRRVSDVKEQLIEANRALVEKDKQRIACFIKRNNWNMQETETGLWFEILDTGEGSASRPGLLATIDYKVSLLDSTICYTSDESGLKTFEIGRGGVESGLEQGILLLNEGARARLIIPPYLAYGLPGDGNKIPARSIIIYELELKSLLNKN